MPRQQRYRITIEVDLEDRGDYQQLRDFIDAAIAPIKEYHFERGRVRCDFLSIEKAPK